MELLVPVLMVVLASLIMYALFDCARTPAARIRHVPRALWLLIMLSAPILGSLAWTYWGKHPADDPSGSPDLPNSPARSAARRETAHR